MTRLMNQDSEENSYAKEILKEQMAMGWEGLTKEVLKYCDEVRHPNPCTEYLNRKEVSEALLFSHLKILKEE